MQKKKSEALIFAVVFAGLLFLDQLTKYLARKYLAESVPVIKNVFHLTLVRNTGSLFGLFQNANVYLIWLSLIAIGFLLYYYDNIPKKFLPKILVLFLFAGIVGNLVDRLVFGYVTDFIDFRIWPVFNLSDSLIVIGVIGLLVWVFLKER